MPDASVSPELLATADREGRFLDALGLSEDSSMEAIRDREIHLCHRYRVHPEVVAAVHHAADMAVEGKHTNLDAQALVVQLKAAWQPLWGVPADDYPKFLGTRFHLDVLVGQHVRSAYQATHLCGEALSDAAMKSVLEQLGSQEPELRSDMADWYCDSAAKKREQLVTWLNTASSSGPSQFRPAAAAALEMLEGSVLLWIGNALRLAPQRPEIASFHQTVQKDIVELRRAIEVPRTLRYPALDPANHRISTISTTTPRDREHDTAMGCVYAIVGWGVFLGVIFLLSLLCEKCGK